MSDISTTQIVQAWVNVHYPGRGEVVEVNIKDGAYYSEFTGGEPPEVVISFDRGPQVYVAACDFSDWLQEVFAANA